MKRDRWDLPDRNNLASRSRIRLTWKTRLKFQGSTSKKKHVSLFLSSCLCCIVQLLRGMTHCFLTDRLQCASPPRPMGSTEAVEG